MTGTLILGMYNTGSTTTAGDIQVGPGSGGDTPSNWKNTRDTYMDTSRVLMRRTFNSNFPTSYAASAAAGNDALGITSFLSVKGLPQDVIAGTYDASIDAIAAGAPAGTWLTFYHEPEDDAARGTFTAAQWSTAFQRFYTRVKAANPNVFVAPCHMAYQWGSGMSSTATPSDWSVAGHCDAICVDTYLMEFQTGYTSVANEPRHQRWHAWASTQGKPLGVTEFGIVGKYWTQSSSGVWSYTRPYTDAQRATLLGNSLDWFRANGYILCLYWNAYHGDYDANTTNSTTNVHNWRDWIITPTKSDTETKPLTLQAWNNRVASYGSTVTTPPTASSRKFSYDFENGTNGAAVTTALSGFTSVVGTATYSNGHVEPAAGGTLAGRFTATAGQAYAKAPLPAAIPAAWSRLKLYVETLPAANCSLYQPLAGTTDLCELRITPAGAVQLRNSSFTQVAISPTGLIPAATHVRIEHYYSNTAGQQQARVYVGANVNGSTPDWDSGPITTTAAGAIDGFQVGIINSTTATYDIDNIAVDSAGWIGSQVTADVPPTASATASTGTAQPGTTVTLTGTGSDSDGTVVSGVWAQTAGTAVPLSGASTAVASFVTPSPPAGDTLTFSYTVTDNGGLTATAPVSVVVPPSPSSTGTVISATPQPDAVPPRVRLDVITDQTSLNLYRVSQDGTRTPLRTYDGGPLPVSAGSVYIYDSDVPQGELVTYTADGAKVADSAPVTIDSGRVWLVDPAVPARSLPVLISGMSQRQAGAAQSVRWPLGREFPIVANDGVRKAETYTLQVRTEGRAELFALKALLASLPTLFLNVPVSKQWVGLQSEYIAVGDLSRANPTNWEGFQYREWSLPCSVTDAPTGGSQAFITYGYSESLYPTYGDRLAAHATYGQAFDPA